MTHRITAHFARSGPTIEPATSWARNVVPRVGPGHGDRARL